MALGEKLTLREHLRRKSFNFNFLAFDAKSISLFSINNNKIDVQKSQFFRCAFFSERLPVVFNIFPCERHICDKYAIKTRLFLISRLIYRIIGEECAFQKQRKMWGGSVFCIHFRSQDVMHYANAKRLTLGDRLNHLFRFYSSESQNV